MRRFLLDTNHLSKAIDPNGAVAQRIVAAQLDGHRVGVCLPVLCELEAGMRFVSRPLPYRKSLDQLLKRVRVWPMDVSTAKLYGDLFAELRSKGRVLSSVDMMIAALARQLDCIILTADRDFDAVSDLAVENWLTDPPEAGRKVSP